MAEGGVKELKEEMEKAFAEKDFEKVNDINYSKTEAVIVLQHKLTNVILALPCFACPFDSIFKKLVEEKFREEGLADAKFDVFGFLHGSCIKVTSSFDIRIIFKENPETKFMVEKREKGDINTKSAELEQKRAELENKRGEPAAPPEPVPLGRTRSWLSRMGEHFSQKGKKKEPNDSTLAAVLEERAASLPRNTSPVLTTKVYPFGFNLNNTN